MLAPPLQPAACHLQLDPAVLCDAEHDTLLANKGALVLLVIGVDYHPAAAPAAAPQLSRSGPGCKIIHDRSCPWLWCASSYSTRYCQQTGSSCYVQLIPCLNSPCLCLWQCFMHMVPDHHQLRLLLQASHIDHCRAGAQHRLTPEKSCSTWQPHLSLMRMSGRVGKPGSLLRLPSCSLLIRFRVGLPSPPPPPPAAPAAWLPG